MSARVQTLWTAAEAASATGGKARGLWSAQGVSIDSRTVRPGDLFVAIPGPKHDGHDFVKDALAARASAAVVDHVPTGMSSGAPLLVVPDTLEALRALGAAARARSRARIVAVTGSVGKTGTKELIAHALRAGGPTTASAGNLNNHFGAPLSLARLPASAAFGVFELGMNSPGEIAPLSQLVRPHVALVTTVEAVHTEFFDSIEAVADAKAEIFEGLERGAVAVLNSDNRFFDRLGIMASDAGAAAIIGFGASEDADARLLDWRPTPGGSHVRADVAGTVMEYDLGLAGRHWALNSVAALAAAQAAGVPATKAAPALAGLSALKGRGERHRVALDDGTFDLIDESYNASPTAVRAALETLASFTPGPGGRRIAVLGDMLELGAEAEALHAELAEAIERSGIDLAFTAGPLMAHLHLALPAKKRGAHASSAAEIIAPLRAALQPGDVVLVKGSLGSRMGQIVDALLRSVDALDQAANGR